MCFVVSPERSWQALTLSAAGKCQIYSNFTTYVIYMKRWNTSLLSGTTVLKGILLAGGRSPWAPRPYWVSCKCHLHVSQLYLPPTTSSRLVLASGVTAMSVLSHSTTTILEAAASLVFILTYSFRIQIINFSVSWCCPHTHSHSLSHKHTVHQVLISCCHWSELEMKLYSCSWITLTHKGVGF